MSAIATVRRTATLGLVAASTGLAACGVSEQQEIALGRQYAAQINAQLPIVDDPVIHRYINTLGNRIAAQSQRPNLDYQFYVANIEAVNAFALPGGFIYLNRELIERTDNLAELAGVLAHEIGHVEQRHSVEQLERMQAANVGLALGSILLGRPPSQLEQVGVQVVGTAVFAGYSRGAENEADAVAVRILPRAGIDPTGLVTFFKELLDEQERDPTVFEQWFSTHPLTDERIANVRAMLREVPPSTLRQLTVNTEDYEAFKRRVAALPAPPPEYRARR